MAEKQYLVEFSGINASGVSLRHSYSTHGCLAPSETIINYLLNDTFTAADGTPLEGRTPSPTQPGTSTWSEIGITSSADTGDVYAVASNAMYAASGRRAGLIDLGITQVTMRTTIKYGNSAASTFAGLVLRGARIATGGSFGDELNGFVAFIDTNDVQPRLRIGKYESGYAMLGVGNAKFDAGELGVTADFTLEFTDTGTELIATILESPHISVRYSPGSTYSSNTLCGIMHEVYSANSVTFSDVKAFRLTDNLAYSDDRVTSALSLSSSLNMSNRFIGLASVAAGNISLNNGDRSLDSMVNESFRGQSITVKQGDIGANYSDMTLVFQGRIDQLVFDTDTTHIQISRSDASLDLPLQPKTFSGAGDKEGGADMKAKRKPLCYGVVYNVPLPLLDDSNASSRPEYFVHDGGVNAITQVYFAGAAKTSGVDYNTLTASNVTTVELLATPAGQVTADVQGDSVGGYVNYVASIIKRIAEDDIKLYDSQINASAFSSVDTAAPYPAGLYINTSDVTRRDALHMLSQSIRAAVYVDRLEQLTIAIINEPAASADHSIDESTILSVKMVSRPPALKEVTWGYQPNEQIQSESDLAGSVTYARKQFLAEKHRLVVATDGTVARIEPYAETFRVDSRLSDSANAQTVANAFLALHAPEKNMYEISGKGIDFGIDLGETVAVTWPRFGMDSGKNLLVVKIFINASNDTYTLSCWG